MLIATHYLLLKNWDIFATRHRILLIINIDYFRGGEVNTTYDNDEGVHPKGCTLFLPQRA